MIKKVLLAGAAMFTLSVPAHAVVLYSDNFDANVQGLNAAPSGWTVSNGTVDIIGTPGAFPWYPTTNIDMNGSTSDGGKITTLATFNLVAGQQYKISFDYGNNKNSNGVEQMTFGIGGYTGVLNVPGAVPSLLSNSFTFVAAVSVAGASLFFEDTGATDGDNGGVILDNVKLSAVPLPAAAPLLISGLMGLGLIARRRKIA
jgi:hypothetical protein